MVDVSGCCDTAPEFGFRIIAIMSGNPLGKSIPNSSKYDPGILYPIPRGSARSMLDIEKKLRMHGFDHWRSYELSWLNSKGKPTVAIAEIFFDVDSVNIVESKSLKLYLNSLNQERFPDSKAVSEVIAKDLSAVSRSEVRVSINGLESITQHTKNRRDGKLIDSLDIEIASQTPDESLLKNDDDLVSNETLLTDLFRSNCPVTGAPDWASVLIRYSGMKINESQLLNYLCSFRQHQGYHEECAERIFRDIMQRCEPEELTLSMNYLRRGGIEINVYRSSMRLSVCELEPRLIRQ